MALPLKNKAPQPANPARKSEDSPQVRQIAETVLTGSIKAVAPSAIGLESQITTGSNSSPANGKAPQPTSSVHIVEDSLLTSMPTLLGTPPAGMDHRFAPVPLGQLPEFIKLPPARGRCPLTGASRSWLLDQEKNGTVKIVRVRQHGKMRGACFLYVPSLMALLRDGLEGGVQ